MLGLIGLARKAGKLVIGEQAVLKALQLSQVRLLLLAVDSSNRKRRIFAAHAEAHSIPLIEWATKTQLGSQLGKQQVAVAAIIDPSLAQAVWRKWEDMGNQKLRG